MALPVDFSLQFMMRTSRFSWIVALVAFLSLLEGLWLFFTFEGKSPLLLGRKPVGQERTVAGVSLDLSQSGSELTFALPRIKDEIFLSMEPPRPGSFSPSTLKVKLRGSEQERRVLLGEGAQRLDLCYSEEGQLEFASEPSLFWAEVFLVSSEEVKVSVFVRSGQEERRESFLSTFSEAFSTSLPEESPLKMVAAARWVGQNLFEKTYRSSSLFLVELAGERLSLRPSEVLVFQGGRWQRGDGKESVCVARIKRILLNSLEWEGWDRDRYYRFQLPLLGEPHLHEGEFLSNVRIRSSKQISCAIDKQCLILKAGDFALKQNGTWKVLRKAVDRDAFVDGRLKGDLFVFDRIDEKGGGNVVVGHLFRSGCTQMQRIEVAIQQRKRNAKKQGADRIDVPTRRGTFP